MLNFAQELRQFLNPRQALALTLVGYELYELSLTCPWVGRVARWGIIGAALWPDIVEAVADARESFTVTPPAATAKDAVVRADRSVLEAAVVALVASGKISVEDLAAHGVAPVADKPEVELPPGLTEEAMEDEEFRAVAAKLM